MQQGTLLVFCVSWSCSWTGVTVALPFTAIGYAFAAILAVIILQEHVPPLCWARIVLVIIGVIFIAGSGGET
jgi:drug/metabolite transporter (DMT)-like permease